MHTVSLPSTTAAPLPQQPPTVQEPSLQADELCFRTLVERAEDIFTVLEADGRIVYDSPAVQRLLGYHQGELVGRNAFEFVHPDDLALAFGMLVETVSNPGPGASLVLRFLHRDGEWRYLESAGQVVDPAPFSRVVVTSRDVTARVRETERARANARELEIRLGSYSHALAATEIEMLQRLARAAEYRDDDTGQHTRRVGDLAATLALALGLPETEVDLIRRAAPLHDLGKIGIRDSILLKPGPLSGAEAEVMRTHTVLGARLLGSGHSELIRSAESIALNHHERWDGCGYPQGLRAEEIPLAARIVSVADVYDALTHDRPYRQAWALPMAFRWIEEESGSRFDPVVAETFLRLRSGVEVPRNGGDDA